MKYRSCINVLVGEKTSEQPWVKYEIIKAWAEGKGLMGIYIHNLKDPKMGKCNKGINPFEKFTFKDINGNIKNITCYNPDSTDPYKDIKENIEDWIEKAINERK